MDNSRLKKNKNYPYDLVHYRDTRKFSSDAYSAWLEMMNIRKKGQEQLTKEKEGFLGFLLVNLLVTDGYILQLDFKDDPEEYLVDFVNERLEIDYNNEPIERMGITCMSVTQASTAMEIYLNL